MGNKKQQLMLSVMLCSFVCMQMHAATFEQRRLGLDSLEQRLFDVVEGVGDEVEAIADCVVDEAGKVARRVGDRAQRAANTIRGVGGNRVEEVLDGECALDRGLDQQEDDEVVSFLVRFWRKYGWITKSHGKDFEKKLKADMDQRAVQATTSIERQISETKNALIVKVEELGSAVGDSRLALEEGMKQSGVALQELRNTGEQYHKTSMTEIEGLGSKITEVRREIEPQLVAQRQQLSDMHQQQKSWFEKFSRRLFAQSINVAFMKRQAMLQAKREQEEDEARDEQWHTLSEDLAVANNEMKNFKRKYSLQKLDEAIQQNKKNEEQCKRSVELEDGLSNDVKRLSGENTALKVELSKVVGHRDRLGRGAATLMKNNAAIKQQLQQQGSELDNVHLLLGQMLDATDPNGTLGKHAPELSPEKMHSPLPSPREEPLTPRMASEGSLTPRMVRETSSQTTPLHSPRDGSQTPTMRPQSPRTDLQTECCDLKEEMSLDQLLYGQDQATELSVQEVIDLYGDDGEERTNINSGLYGFAQMMSQDKPGNKYKKDRDTLRSKEMKKRQGGATGVPLFVKVPGAFRRPQRKN